MSNPWFRLYSEAVDDEKLRLLAFEDRWHFIALLCCKNTGILDDPSPLMRRKVAVKLGLDLRELDEVVRRLSEVGLIDQESFQPVSWDKRQYKSDKDETAAARQKRFRESRKSNALRNGDSNADITPSEADTHTDSDSNSETELKTHTNEHHEDLTPVCVTPIPVTPGKAGSCCRVMIESGIQGCNPCNPTLLALLQAGANEEEFAYAAREATSRGNTKFNYVIGIVKKQREDAANLNLHKGRMPNKQEKFDPVAYVNRFAKKGSEYDETVIEHRPADER